MTKTICLLIPITACVLSINAAADNGYFPDHHYLKRCETPYDDHGVYETTIVYGADETVTGPLVLPMDSTRNTDAYRRDAYDFFSERFGLQFDPSDWGPQRIADSAGATASVAPVKTGEGSTHQVHGLDAQHIRQWQGKFPVTNVAFFDDGFFVTLEANFRVHGTFGGTDGIVLPIGTQLVFGEYRMVDHRGRLLDTIVYKSNIPVTAVPVSGNPAGSDGAIFVTIACDVESKRFGKGTTRALGEIRPLGDGRTHIDFRYTMHFPAQLADADVRRPQCDRVRRLRHRYW